MFIDNIDISSNTGIQFFEIGCHREAFRMLPHLFQRLSGKVLTDIKFYNFPKFYYSLNTVENLIKIRPSDIWSVMDEELSGPGFPSLKRIKWTMSSCSYQEIMLVHEYLETHLPRCMARDINLVEISSIAYVL